MKHVKAEDVLPAALVHALRRYHTGYIYVSSRREEYEEQRRKVMEFRRRGLATAEIAAQVHLCERRVRQILAKGRKRIPKRTSADSSGQSGGGVVRVQ